MRSLSLRTVWVLILYLMLAHSSSAQTFYQCLNAQGRPEFSETACRPGSSQNDVQSSTSAQGRTESELQTEKMDSIRCRRARKDLDAAVSAISSKRRDMQTRRAAMYAACGMKYPPEVTIINNPSSYSR
jgi:hypothetical protein